MKILYIFKRIQRQILLTIVLLSASTGLLFGQVIFNDYKFDTSSVYIIQLIDKAEFIGKFIGKDDEYVFLKTNSIAKIDIPFLQIKKIDIVAATNVRKSGQYWFPNPNATRYLFGPSAIPLKKKEGYYQNTYLAMNLVNYGITDNIAIGGGVELFSLSASIVTDGEIAPIYFLTPKVGFEITDEFYLAGGAIYAHFPSLFDEEKNGSSAGIAFGVGTYGNIEHNFTGGLGWGFFQGDFMAKPILYVSGMTRIGRRTALVCENWIVPFNNNNYYPVFSYGIRFFGEKLSLDLAFINNHDIIRILPIGIPYVDFVVKF